MSLVFVSFNWAQTRIQSTNPATLALQPEKIVRLRPGLKLTLLDDSTADQYPRLLLRLQNTQVILPTDPVASYMREGANCTASMETSPSSGVALFGGVTAGVSLLKTLQ